MHSGRKAYDGTRQVLLVRNRGPVRWHRRTNMPSQDIPHVSTKDDVWEEYHIPKGSSIFVNIGYAPLHSGFPSRLPLTFFCRNRFILRDPRLWDDPDAFRPERFLGKERPPFDPLSVVFGFGRRLVPAPREPGTNDLPYLNHR